MSTNRSGPPKSEPQPCAICGWGADRAIHLPVLEGPCKGQPWGHAYRAPSTAMPADA